MLSINRLKAEFISRYKNFFDIVAETEVEIDYGIETACTNGIKIFINPEYMNKLSEKEQIFVFAHEMFHIVFDHIARSEGKDPYYWNIATDAVINSILNNEGFVLTENCIKMKDAMNKNAEEIYEQLIKEKEKEKDKPQETPPDNDNSKRGNGKPVDSPSNNPNPPDDNNKENGKGNSSGSDGNDNNKEDGKENSSGHDGNDNNNEKKNEDGGNEKGKPSYTGKAPSNHNRWEEGRKEIEKKRKEENKQGNEKEKKKIDENEIAQKGKDNNNRNNNHDGNQLPGGELNPIGGIGAGSGRSPVHGNEDDDNIIDWISILEDTLNLDRDWNQRQLEEENGILRPRYVASPSPKTEIIIDTSGSMSDELIRGILGQCKNIINESETSIGFMDSDFSGFHDVNSGASIDDIMDVKNNGSLFGGGGTASFDEFAACFTDNADNKIVFTDGYASPPQVPNNVIWVVCNRIKPYGFNPNGGKVIYVCGEQYEKLCSSSKGKTR